MNDLINKVSAEFGKYEKYIVFATVAAAFVVSVGVIVGLVNRKG